MDNRYPRPLLAVAACAALAGSLLVGCDQRSPTVDGPAGTARSTTVGPNGTDSQTVARAGEVVGDAAITAKVKSALLADPDVKGLRIDVDTRNGVVTLNGTADQRANVDKATSIARGIDGVKSVQNRLTVKSTG
jgi:hyperosmotically inducible protein